MASAVFRALVEAFERKGTVSVPFVVVGRDEAEKAGLVPPLPPDDPQTEMPTKISYFSLVQFARIGIECLLVPGPSIPSAAQIGDRPTGEFVMSHQHDVDSLEALQSLKSGAGTLGKVAVIVDL